MNKVTNIVVAGLGGQGVLKARTSWPTWRCAPGYDVKKSEIKGMSQRGGSVTGDVRFGEQVFSPMVPAGRGGLPAGARADAGGAAPASCCGPAAC